MEIPFQMDHHNQAINGIVDFLIIGGGVAALSAANRLVDLNETPVLIENMSYPSHKVCGEFISPEALPFLADWGIVPECLIKKADFFAGSLKYQFDFPEFAGSISRYRLDALLADRAKKLGATILENTRVIDLKPIKTITETLYSAKLSDGSEIISRNVFIGGGRFFTNDQNSVKMKMPYFGFKAHFSGIDLPEILEMHILKNAYLGISSIDKNVVNVACLVKIEKPVTDKKSFINHFLASPDCKRIQKKLETGNMLFDWLYTLAPELKAKANPYLKNVCFIGDAAGSIAPATGNGLGMAITSGYMAADYAISQDDEGFYKAWKKRYASRIKRGHLLHQILMQPSLAKASFFVCQKIPFIPKMIFSATREK